MVLRTQAWPSEETGFGLGGSGPEMFVSERNIRALRSPPPSKRMKGKKGKARMSEGWFQLRVKPKRRFSQQETPWKRRARPSI